jgi:hypothetical protein
MPFSGPLQPLLIHCPRRKNLQIRLKLLYKWGYTSKVLRTAQKTYSGIRLIHMILIDPFFWISLVCFSIFLSKHIHVKYRQSLSGKSLSNASHNCTAGWCVNPANITCSKHWACLCTASAMWGCPWPCKFTHQLEIKSNRGRLSGGSVYKNAPEKF